MLQHAGARYCEPRSNLLILWIGYAELRYASVASSFAALIPCNDVLLRFLHPCGFAMMKKENKKTLQMQGFFA
jgi:hypothetical protein